MHVHLNNKSKLYNVVESLEEHKCITIANKIYKFFVKNNTLSLHIYYSDTKNLYGKYIIHDNIKLDFDVCIDEKSIVHIIMVNRKYEIIYAKFDNLNLTKEKVFGFNNVMGIPNSPIIRINKNEIYVIASFILLNSEKQWSIHSFSFINGSWHSKKIDKSKGLCYNQHDACLDMDGNIHLVYRYLDKYKFSNLKYTVLSKRKWSRPEYILHDGFNKYSPHIYCNRLNQIYFQWTYFDSEVYLCIVKKTKYKDAFKIDITEDIGRTIIIENRDHIYMGILGDKNIFYDLSCKKQSKIDMECFFPIIKEGEYILDTKIKTFLDIKRELEQQIVDLQNKIILDRGRNLTIMDEINCDKERIKKEIEQKDMRLNELSSTINCLTSENSELREYIQSICQSNYQIMQLEQEHNLYNTENKEKTIYNKCVDLFRNLFRS